MSLGSLYLKLQQKYQHGLRTAWYRDHVREQILETRPFTSASSEICEIHVLTSQTDYLNLIWALKSFYFYSQRNYSLCIHEDGTLQQPELNLLQHHFPDARIVLKKEADQVMSETLASYPEFAETLQSIRSE